MIASKSKGKSISGIYYMYAYDGYVYMFFKFLIISKEPFMERYKVFLCNIYVNDYI